MLSWRVQRLKFLSRAHLKANPRIGRRAISAILNAHDECCETALTGLIFQSWKIDTIDELVQRANSTAHPDFPRLFAVVLRAADGGDSLARALLAEAGSKLAALAAIVIRRLAQKNSENEFAKTVPSNGILSVAMTGSVFRQSSEVRQVFCNVLETGFPGIDVRQEMVEPVDGALARARKMV